MSRVFCGYWPKHCRCKRRCRYHTKRFQLASDVRLMLNVLYIKTFRR